MRFRAAFILGVLLLAGSLSPSTRPVPPCTAGASAAATPQRDAIDQALARATAYLLAQQHADGLWRSSTYGSMRDGLVLTPPIAKAISFAAAHDPRARAAFVAAVRALVDAAPREGRGRPMPYPVSTAALSIVVLHRAEAILGEDERFASACSAWMTELLRHQLTDAQGWSSDDADFGGWGYSIDPPARPDDALLDALPFGSDLSSTLLAIGALGVDGVAPDAPPLRDARVFVLRCQNWSSEHADHRIDDGGFTTTPHRTAQNKAGDAGFDASGQQRFHSYGSATADGLRALLRCGLPVDHPRVVAARRWLEASFDPSTNPGRFTAFRAHEQDAARFYWAWSIAHAWRALEAAAEKDGVACRRNHAARLIESLLSDQRSDGSWRNESPFMKEDDPLIATLLAMGALGTARDLASPGPR